MGDIEHDGVDYYLHVTEKRNKKARKILLDAARAVLAYIEAAGIEDLGGAAFAADLASMLHETQTTRLFRS